MAETNAERLEKMTNQWWRQWAGQDAAWVLSEAKRVQELEDENSHLIKIGNLKINRLQDENKLLQDKLNYVKSLVESKRAGHAIKFDLQMMFREDAK